VRGFGLDYNEVKPAAVVVPLYLKIDILGLSDIGLPGLREIIFYRTSYQQRSQAFQPR
jgi:hypothetical protein